MNIFFPLEWLANSITYNLFNITPESVLAESVNFFIYDGLKIFILLILITHLMSLIRFYLPIKKFQAFLISRKFYGLDYFLATSFGALTPFCSCSSIPLFIGFLQAGLPLGITFSFLITSPLINEIALALFLSLFGWKITLLYLGAGIGVGMVGGFILGKLKMDKYVLPIAESKDTPCACGNFKPKFKNVALFISSESFAIVKKVSLFIIIGVGVGAVIHGYVPANFFESYLNSSGILSVPLAVILAVPLYANASGVIPVIEALIDKGVPLGTALAFMMAIVGLSLPEAFMLKRILKLPLLIAFFGIVSLGIIFIGYLFNFVV